MSNFIVKAVSLDGISWPLQAMLRSLDSKELGATEWWRRMSVMQHAAGVTGDSDLQSILGKKRFERYGESFEAPEVVNSNNLPPLSVEETIKRWFQKLTEEKQIDFLKNAVNKLLGETDNLGKNIFSNKQGWIGVYLVLHDRQLCKISKNDFHNFAKKITPDDCPKNKKISSSTMTNFSKVITFNKKYYEMRSESFPLYELCNAFWSIIKALYFAKDSTND